MSFLFTLAILCAVTIATPVPASRISSPNWSCLGVLSCVLLMPAIAFVLRSLVLARLRRNPNQKRDHLRLYLKVERLFPLIWVLTSVSTLFVFQWQAIVRFNWGLNNALLLDELLLLSPILLPWFFVWCIQYDIETWQKSNRRERWNKKKTTFRWRLGLARRLRFGVSQSRHFLGIVVVPLLVVSTCWDINQRLMPELANSEMGWMTMLVPLIVLFVAFPILLRFLWPTSALSDATLRCELFKLVSQANLSVRDIFVWRTSSGPPNAAMTGILPSLRYIFLTKSLTDGFRNSEVQAAFAHELGHVRFHHNGLRMLALMLPVVTIGSMVSGLTRVASWMGLDLVSIFSGPAAILPVLICLCGTVGYLIIGFGWFCRQLEYQADFYACQLLAKSAGSKVAWRRYSSVLERLAAGSETDRREWLHPSWDQRQGFLRRMRADDSLRRQFQRQLTWLNMSILAATFSGCCACVWRACTG